MNVEPKRYRIKETSAILSIPKTTLYLLVKEVIWIRFIVAMPDTHHRG